MDSRKRWQSLKRKLPAEPQVAVPRYLLSQEFGPCQLGGSWIKVVIEQMVKCSTYRLTEFGMGQYVFVGAVGERMGQPFKQGHEETTSEVP